MIVNDIWSQARKIFGSCSESDIYRLLNLAIELCSNKGGTWNPRIGRMTLDGTDGYITLPYDVETPLQLNIDGYSTFARDQWFRYHANGPGAHTNIDSYNSFWDDVGNSPLARDITTADYIQVVGTHVEDATKVIRIFGQDENGDEIVTSSGRGIELGIGDTSAIKISKVYSISKDVTVGVVRLLLQTQGCLIGQYMPQETNPTFRRIRVPVNSTIDLIYTRRTVDVSSLYDYIPLESKLAMVSALRAVKCYEQTDDIQKGQAYEAQVERIMKENQNAKAVRSGIGFQIRNFSSDYDERLRSGSCCR